MKKTTGSGLIYAHKFILLTICSFMMMPVAVEASETLWNRETMTGDWGGARSKLEKKGISLEMVYTAETNSVISGGLEQKTVYLDNRDIVLSVDAETLMGWKGAEFSLYVLGNFGDSPSEYVGDLQILSNIDTDNTWKIYEAWYQQKFLNGRVSIKIGLYDLNSEFDVMENAGMFSNSSFGIGMDYSQSGLNGPSIFSTTSLALRLRLEPKKNVYILGAVLDGVPGDPDNPKGTHVKLKKEDGLLLAAEIGISGEKNNRYYKIGMGGWVYTGDFECIPNAPGQGGPIIQKGNKGIYLLAEHQLLVGKDRENKDTNDHTNENSGQGLAAFFRIGAADNRVNRIGYYVGTGLVYTGLIPGRDDDQLGLGIAHARNGKRFRQLSNLLDLGYETAETAVELAYLMQLTPWLTLKPGIQFIINPGTEQSIENGFVFGLRSEISL